MGCLINNIYALNVLNECSFNVPGLTQLFVAPYNSNIYSKLTIFNNQITDIDASVKFTELEANKFNSKYSESYNYETKKYEQNLFVEILKLDWNKRNSIDSLIKTQLVIIFKDANGKYYILGEKSGVASNQYSATTDVYLQNKSIYTFNFFGKSDYPLFGVAPELIDKLTDPDCSDLWGTQPTWSPLFWTQYQDCSIADLPGFIEP